MKYYFFCVCFLCVSCTLQRNTVFDANKNDFYKVNKIIEEQSYYIIYLQRNDSTFKIISDITNVLSNCKKIKIGEKYKLILNKTAPIDSFGKISIIPNLGVTGMEMPDGSIVTFEEKSHYSIYRTKNLIGLCIQE